VQEIIQIVLNYRNKKMNEQIEEKSIKTDKSQIEFDENFDYPYLLTRYKASLIDGVLLACLLGVILFITPSRDNWQVEGIIFFIIVILYEPILLSIFSATVGHSMMGLKVISLKNKNRKLNIFQGLIRTIVKLLLGWISFFTINFNPGHRAMHDYLSSSIVLKDE
jgi:uncharacterized RDD family membrane protein YckC